MKRPVRENHTSLMNPVWYRMGTDEYDLEYNIDFDSVPEEVGLDFMLDLKFHTDWTEMSKETKDVTQKLLCDT